MKRTNKTLVTLALVSVLGLSGCAAVTTAVKKQDLEVKTQMSDTVWLDPVSSDKRTVFVKVRNTTDKQIDIMSALNAKLAQKGYKVVQNPDAAHYWLQTNILKLDKMDLRESQSFLSSGYGASIGGAAVGALATGAFTSRSGSLAAGGLIGAAVGLVANAVIEDVNYSMITDVQIVEKTEHKVTTTEQANIKSGNSSHVVTQLNTVDNKKRFQTRVISNANQVNLKFEEAKPALIDGLTTSITGVF